MNKIKVGINGFGRIGRNVMKIALERGNIEIIGINDLTSTSVLAHLLKYDSTQGKFNGTVSFDDTNLIINGVRIPVTAERSPINIRWATSPDVVVESTGVFRSKESAKGGYGDHLKNGAKKVILTVPAKDDIDRMIVIGVNDNDLKETDQCISNASCTTNCLAPVAKVLNDRFGIQVRGGCSCAGTYGHYLLHIEREYSHHVTCLIDQGNFSEKAGWIRMSLHPTNTEEEMDFILEAIRELARKHASWSDDYRLDRINNEISFKNPNRDNWSSERIKGLFHSEKAPVIHNL